VILSTDFDVKDELMIVSLMRGIYGWKKMWL